MAKSEFHVTGSFDEIIQGIHEELWQQSDSLTLEEKSRVQVQDRNIELRVYERYSFSGGNRSSLTVQFIETDDGADICGIATGGSGAMFWKINTLGEAAFLETLEIAVQHWNSKSE